MNANQHRYNRPLQPYDLEEEVTNPRNSALRHLNELLGMVANAQRGFEIAKDDVKNDKLRNLFTDLERMHARHYGKLYEVLDYFEDEKPREKGTLTGKLHRTWLDLKAKLSDNNEGVILESVRFGEQQLDKAYQNALRGSEFLKSRQAYHDRVAEQHEEVKAALARIDSMYKTVNKR